MFIVAGFLGAAGQLLYKHGATLANRGWTSYLNWAVLVGVANYVAVMVLFIGAFKAGGQPAVLYPIYASTFIWAALMSWWWLGHDIRPVHLAGFALLVMGMVLMGR